MKELSEELYDLGLNYLQKSFQTYEVYVRNDFYDVSGIKKYTSFEPETQMKLCDMFKM